MPRIAAASLAENRARRTADLLQAARQLHAEAGIGAVTIAAVAGRTGLTRSSVYEYFDSTASLRSAAIASEAERWADGPRTDDVPAQVAPLVHAVRACVADGSVPADLATVFLAGGIAALRG